MAMDSKWAIEPMILENMAQQPQLIRMKDDWTGVTSAAERRRIQNRLNQRALRKRKQTEIGDHSPAVSKSSANPPSFHSSEIDIQRPSSQPPQVIDLWDLFDSGARNSDRQKLCRVATVWKSGGIEQQRAIAEFERWVRYYQTLGSPKTECLLVLVKFNVFRALMSNGFDLDYTPRIMMDDNALSPLSDPSRSARVLPLPEALQPTELQRKIVHHPWIDALAIPGMRDNLLRAEGTYSHAKLCAALVVLYSRSKREGMIIWGEPWDVNSYEITEDFLKDWGWTVKGCKQLFQATNYWRQKRGEKPLYFNQGFIEDVSD